MSNYQLICGQPKVTQSPLVKGVFELRWQVSDKADPMVADLQ
jgi:hypothetical protein